MMNLTYNKGYEDYSDRAHWAPIFEELKAFYASLTPAAIAAMGNDQLLEAMEKVEELLRYYCASRDFVNLEPPMRRFNDMLQQCRARGIRGVEASYLEMVFLRLNAILYRGHGQNMQAAQCYDQCMDAAQKCYAQLRSSNLTDEQIVYVGWNCVECFKEAAETNDNLLNSAATVQVLNIILPMLGWLEPYIQNTASYGICDQAAEQYASIAGVLYQHQECDTAQRCFKRAVALFNGLDERIGSDFYRARAIWIHCIYGYMEYFQRGNAAVILECEQDVDRYFLERPYALARDKAIVEGAKGIVQMQRAVALQQNGNLSQAIQQGEAGLERMENALDVLEQDYKPRQDYYRTVVYRIAARIFNSYIGALDSVGVMYYQNDDHELAEETFKTAMDKITDSTDYTMGESGAAMIRAEVNQYMALIAFDRGDGYQADFYGTQSADAALELGEQNVNPLAWDLAVLSCAVVAEINLAMKNKKKAGEYADRGLMACDQLQRHMPQNPKVELRSALLKLKKKANRWLF